jgi:anti-anti-sigma factor
MDAKIDTSGALTVVTLSGEFNLGDEGIISEDVQPLVATQGSRLAIEMSGLDQINSMGLSELINVVIRARLSQSRVVLVSPSKFVTSVFEVTRLHEWFEVVDDLAEAESVLADK